MKKVTFTFIWLMLLIELCEAQIALGFSGPDAGLRSFKCSVSNQAQPNQNMLEPVSIGAWALAHLGTLKDFSGATASRAGLDIDFASEELARAGIKADQIAVFVRLERISLRSVLRLLLDRHKLAYVIADERLLVTTRGHAMSVRAKGQDDGTPKVSLDGLKSDEVAVRRDAAFALGQRPSDTERALELLLGALNDRDRQVRFDAAFALGELHGKATPALPALIEILNADDDSLRQVAALAIGKIGRAAYCAMMDALGHENPEVVAAAAQGLSEMGTNSQQVATAIFEVCKQRGEKGFLVIDVAGALSRMDRQSVMPAVIAGITEEDRLVRELALWTLQLIGPAAEAAVPQLTAALKHDDPHTRQHAASILSTIGPRARTAAPVLVEALTKDPVIAVRAEAAHALRNIGVTDQTVIEALLGVTRTSDDARLLHSAALALASLARDNIPLLVSLLKEPKSAVRSTVASRLGELGPRAEGAVDALIELLKDEDATVRWSAAGALGEIGSKAKRAIPALREAAKDSDESVRREAERSLRLIEDEMAGGSDGLASGSRSDTRNSSGD